MPFILKKFNDGYKVYNTLKKIYYSKKPIKKENAKKQLALLKNYEKKTEKII